MTAKSQSGKRFLTSFRALVLKEAPCYYYFNAVKRGVVSHTKKAMPADQLCDHSLTEIITQYHS